LSGTATINIPEKCIKLVYISDTKFIKSHMKQLKQNQTKKKQKINQKELNKNQSRQR
jgi:hypothetical protein